MYCHTSIIGVYYNVSMANNGGRPIEYGEK